MIRWRAVIVGKLAIAASALVVCAMALLAPAPARADKIVATYNNPGIEDAQFAALCASASTCYYGEETFSSWAGGTFTSTFSDGTSAQHNWTSTNKITATYAGGFVKTAANQYGGAGGTSAYPEQFGTAAQPYYTISLVANGVPGVNYFGIWISAMDASNVINFYRGGISGTLLYSFTTAQLLSNIGNISAYFGNPNAAFLGQDSSEPFAYVNFFDTTGFFDTVQIYESGGSSAGFESSNDAVGYINPISVIGNSIPEPPAAALMAMALAALTLLRRRRLLP